MDRFTAFFNSKTEGQKVVIGVGLAVLVLLLLVVTYFISTPQTTSKSDTAQTKNQQGASGSNQNISGNNNNQSVPTNIQTSVPSEWQTYRYTDFEISYPPDYVPQLSGIGGGGVNLALAQRPSTITVSSANINLQIYNSKDVPLTQVAGALSALGYAKSKIFVFGLSAEKYSGNFLISTNSASLQTSAVIFQHKDKTYKIQINYVSQGPNKQTEDTFNKIVSTFRFTQ